MQRLYRHSFSPRLLSKVYHIQRVFAIGCNNFFTFIIIMKQVHSLFMQYSFEIHISVVLYVKINVKGWHKDDKILSS